MIIRGSHEDVADKKLPGAVVMVARKGKLVYSQGLFYL